MSIGSQQLQRLTDCSDVRQVVFRFANALDLQDWDLLRSCFDHVIEIDYSDFRGERRTISADEYVEQRRSALAGIKTQHLSFNHEIEIESDQATCHSAALILRIDPAMASENFFNSHCFYEHALVRTSAGWKMTKIEQRVLWNDGNPAVHVIHRTRKAGSDDD